MIKMLLAAAFLAAGFSTCASAQTVTGCGTTAIAKADQGSPTRLKASADCFGKVRAIAAAAEAARLDRIAAIIPTPAPTPTPTADAWTDCAGENEQCRFVGTATVRFGAGGVYTYQRASGAVLCSTGQFGDPAQGVVKRCAWSVDAGLPAPVDDVPTPAPAPGPAPSPTPAPTPLPFVTAEFGINVAPSVYYNSERTFANLVFASSTWDSLGAAGLNSYGFPAATGIVQMNVPQSVWAGVDTRVACTWKGVGGFFIDGDRLNDAYGDHSVATTWKGWTGVGRPQMYLQASGANTTDPMRDVDCREAGVTAIGRFDARAVADLKPYSVLRFLDWSSANGNPSAVTWATRTLPDSPSQSGPDGIAIENMVDLANAAGSDAWFTVPWNADEDYVRRMGALVRDRLAPNHRAYFELSNETWNYSFGVASQVLNEGIAEGLSPDRFTNGLLRYAEKSTWFHKILTDVFAATPARLVRVVNTMNDNTWSMDMVMSFRDTAQWVDAIATAPYFGADLFGGATATVNDLPTLFASLEAKRAEAIDRAVANKRVADRYGKRYITYEAGQHIIPPAANAATAAAMQRSPLMHDAYARYLADWKAKIGDTMMIYSATGPISQYGAWGIREYAGQPLAETPKRRAVLEAIPAAQ